MYSMAWYCNNSQRLCLKHKIWDQAHKNATFPRNSCMCVMSGVLCRGRRTSRELGSCAQISSWLSSWTLLTGCYSSTPLALVQYIAHCSNGQTGQFCVCVFLYDVMIIVTIYPFLWEEQGQYQSVTMVASADYMRLMPLAFYRWVDASTQCVQYIVYVYIVCVIWVLCIDSI